QAASGVKKGCRSAGLSSTAATCTSWPAPWSPCASACATLSRPPNSPGAAICRMIMAPPPPGAGLWWSRPPGAGPVVPESTGPYLHALRARATISQVQVPCRSGARCCVYATCESHSREPSATTTLDPGEPGSCRGPAHEACPHHRQEASCSGDHCEAVQDEPDRPTRAHLRHRFAPGQG